MATETGGSSRGGREAAASSGGGGAGDVRAQEIDGRRAATCGGGGVGQPDGRRRADTRGEAEMAAVPRAEHI